MDDSTTSFTTEMVRGLFGPNIAPIISADKCTHQRVSGRLYIASNALCFYSNIFGFERKLLIRIVDITFAGLTRTTSIIIRSQCIGTGVHNNSGSENSSHTCARGTTAKRTNESVLSGGSSSRESSSKKEANNQDQQEGTEDDNHSSTPFLENETADNNNHHEEGDDEEQHEECKEVVFEEEHTFKSFEERETVLRIILNLMEKKNEDLDHSGCVGGDSSRSSHGNHGDNITLKDRLFDFRETTQMNNGAPTKRSNSGMKKSESTFHWFDKYNEVPMTSSSHLKSTRRRTYSDPRDVYRKIPSSSLTSSSTTTIRSTPNWLKNKELSFRGKKTKDKKQSTSLNEVKLDFESRYPETIVSSYIIPNHTVDEFYHNFLQDDAQWSFKSFQQRIIKDQDIRVTPWTKNAENESYTRSMSFMHPRSSKIGPSTAQTLKEQTYTLFQPSLGLVLSSNTKFDGVPYSDCFNVEEKWIIEPNSNDSCQVSIRFKVNFIKSTIMKKVIYRQTKQEIKDWFELYIKYLDSSTGNDSSSSSFGVKKSTSSSSETERIRFHLITLMFLTLLLLCFFLGGLYHIYFLNLKIKLLEEKIEFLIDELRMNNLQM